MEKKFPNRAPSKYHHKKNQNNRFNKFQNKQSHRHNGPKPFVPHNRNNRHPPKKWINYPPHKRLKIFGYEVVVHHKFKANKRRRLDSYSPFYDNYFNRTKNKAWQLEHHKHLKGYSMGWLATKKRELSRSKNVKGLKSDALKEAKRNTKGILWVLRNTSARRAYLRLMPLKQILAFRQWHRKVHLIRRLRARLVRKKGRLKKWLMLSKKLIRRAGIPSAGISPHQEGNYITAALGGVQPVSVRRKLRKVIKLIRKAASTDSRLLNAAKELRSQQFWRAKRVSKRPTKPHGCLRPVESIFQMMTEDRKLTQLSKTGSFLQQMLHSIEFLKKHLEFILIEQGPRALGRKFRGIREAGWLGKQKAFLKRWFLFDRFSRLERTAKRNWRLYHHARLEWVHDYLLLRARYNRAAVRWQDLRSKNQTALSAIPRTVQLVSSEATRAQMFVGSLAPTTPAVLPTRLLYTLAGARRSESRFGFDNISENVFGYLLGRRKALSPLLQKGTDFKSIYEELLNKRYITAEKAVLGLGLQMDQLLVDKFYKTTILAGRVPWLRGPKKRLPRSWASAIKKYWQSPLHAFYNSDLKTNVKGMVSLLKTSAVSKSKKVKLLERILFPMSLESMKSAPDIFASPYYAKHTINKARNRSGAFVKRLFSSHQFARAFKQKQLELRTPKALANLFGRTTASVLVPSFLQYFKKFWFAPQKAKLLRAKLGGEFSLSNIFSRDIRARIPRHIFRKMSQAERRKELKRIRGWKFATDMQKHLIRAWPGFRYHFGTLRQFAKKSLWTDVSSVYLRALTAARAKRRVLGLKYEYVTNRGWKVSKKARKYNRPLIVHTRTRIIRQRSSDAIRKWASKLSARLEVLPSFSYRIYGLKTIERYVKQGVADFVDHNVVNSFEAITRNIKQNHEKFMEAPKHDYIAVRRTSESVPDTLRLYTLQPIPVSQLKDFVGLRPVSSPFGQITALLSVYKNFITYRPQTFIFPTRFDTKFYPTFATKGKAALLNIKNLLELSPSVKGFKLSKAQKISKGFVLRQKRAVKSDQKLVRRIKSYTGRGHSASLFFGLGDFETTAKGHHGLKRRKLTDVQEVNIRILKRRFRKTSYSRIHGLRNLHYEGADTVWGKELRVGDAHRRKSSEQTRAFKRFISQHHKQLSRFPRRFNKLALKIHKNVFRAFFRRFLGFNESMLLNLWVRFRRGANRYWTGTGITNLVRKFTQSLLLSPQNFLQLLRIAETPSTAHALVRFGGIVVNGQTRTELGYFIKPGDTLQVLPTIFKDLTRNFFWKHNFGDLRTKMNNIKFFQIDWSMLLFTMVYWPKDHELVAPSFLSERWIRFYIHFFPGKIRKRHKSKVKMVWKQHRPFLYPSIKKPRKRMKPRPPRQGRIQSKYLYV